MHFKYSLGFLAASLIQAGIIALTESSNISSLNINMTFSQLLIHVVVGQIAGYILLFAVKKIDVLKNVSSAVLGILWGILLWAVIIPIAVTRGKLNAPWSQDMGTLLSSVAAFIVYGLISAFTIKRYGYEENKKIDI